MTDDQFTLILKKLDAIQQKLDIQTGAQPEDWLDNSDIIRLLKISKNTAAAWREKGILPFTKIGKKIYYQKTEIRHLLKRHRELDGRMSQDFQQAVVDFQKEMRLFADGIIGPQTRTAMEKAKESADRMASESYQPGKATAFMKQARKKASQQKSQHMDEVPEMWKNLARSICQITLPSGNWGTGFLTEGGYVFTASHILPNADAASRAHVIFADSEGLAPFYFEVDEQDFITHSGDISFARVKIKDWDVLKMQPFGQLIISTGLPDTIDFVSLIFAEKGMETSPKFLLHKSISSIHQFDILFDAPETEPGAGVAPIFNEQGEVVAIYDSIVDYMDLRKWVLMKEVMWYINASQGNRFDFLRGLIERGFTAEVLEKLQMEYPDMSELKSYSEEYQKITAELKDGKLPHGEYERLFHNIGYRLNGLISLLESRGNPGSYAA